MNFSFLDFPQQVVLLIPSPLCLLHGYAFTKKQSFPPITLNFVALVIITFSYHPLENIQYFSRKHIEHQATQGMVAVKPSEHKCQTSYLRISPHDKYGD